MLEWVLARTPPGYERFRQLLVFHCPGEVGRQPVRYGKGVSVVPLRDGDSMQVLSTVVGLWAGVASAADTSDALTARGWSCTPDDGALSCTGSDMLGSVEAQSRVSFCDSLGQIACRRTWVVTVPDRNAANNVFFRVSPEFERQYGTSSWLEATVDGFPVARLSGPDWKVAFQVQDERVVVVEEYLDRDAALRAIRAAEQETVLQCVEVVERTSGTSVSVGRTSTSGTGSGDTMSVSSGTTTTNATTREVEVVRFIRFDEKAHTIRVQGVSELISDEDGWARAEVSEFEPTRILAGFRFKVGVRVSMAVRSLGLSETGPFAGFMVSELDRVSGKWRVAGHTFTCDVYDAAARRF